MLKIQNLKIRTIDGRVKKCDPSQDLAEEIKGDVHLFRLNVSASIPLDPEDAVRVVMHPDEENRVQWMADECFCDFWCRPRFGNDEYSVPKNTQALIYQTQDRYGVILPMVSEDYKCTLEGTEDGLTARIYSFDETLNRCCCTAFAYAEGKDPYAMLEACAKALLEASGNVILPRDQRKYPEELEYLGWCSWDALQIRVSEEGIMQKLQELKEKQIPVRWAILDDMWAHIRDFEGAEYRSFAEMVRIMHSSPLWDFEGDPVRFPEGLSHCLQRMKKEYGIRAGVWHPASGYWRGIEKEGPLYEKLKEHLVQREVEKEWAPVARDLEAYVPKPTEEDLYACFDHMHGFLQDAGADFVKVDFQSLIRRFYKGMGPVGQIAKNLHNALEKSVKEHFGGTIINCMGMSSENMWNRPYSAVSRCSDDFLPENRAWFSKHITQCSYNGLIQGQLNVCDWDMWWTDDSQAHKNAALRAISGGPIYVSDPIGRSRKEVLMPLIMDDGRILRCDRTAVPTLDCLTTDPISSLKPFKVMNMAGECGVLAAFDLDPQGNRVSGWFSPADILGLRGERFGIYEHEKGSFQVVDLLDKVDIDLSGEDDFRFFLVIPLDEQGNASIGLIDKYIAPKTSYLPKNTPGYASIQKEKLVIVS